MQNDYIITGYSDHILIMAQRIVLCGKPDELEKRFSAVAGPRLTWEPFRIAAPGGESVILTQRNPKEFSLAEFGMTPSWAGRGMNLTHARAEGSKNQGNDPSYSGSKAIFMKPAFKRPLFNQRCVVVADAFLEWSAVTRQYYLVYLRNRERPFGMAGVYDVWVDPVTRAEHLGFALITVPGNSLMQKIQTFRMPVILPRGKEREWLRPSCHLSDILALLEPLAAERMNAYPVGVSPEERGPLRANDLWPAGERLVPESDYQPFPMRRYGHKTGSAGATSRSSGPSATPPATGIPAPLPFRK